MDDSSGVMSGDELISSYHLPRPLPLWLNAQYAKHIVKGNFMTLSARPKTVEQGEWIAHQGKITLISQRILTGPNAVQLLSIIATCGILLEFSTKRRMMVHPSATLPAAHACLLERR